MQRDLQDFIADVSSCGTSGEMTALMRRFVQSVGFSSFNYVAGRLIRATGRSAPPSFDNIPRYMSTWSTEWIGHYTESGYFAHDPVLRRSLMSALPVDWCAVERRKPIEKQIIGDARDAGLSNGVSFPVHGPLAEFGVISVTSDGSDRDFKKTLAHYKHLLQVASIYLHEAAFNVRRKEPGVGPEQSLTQRETECLVWTTRGKTAGDISDILTISEHTVRFHINNAMRKLGVYSKTHAAAKSMQLGLIAL